MSEARTIDIRPMDGGSGGCTKCVIDYGMGRAGANLYGFVVGRITGLRPIDYGIHQFYIDAVNDFQRGVEMIYHRLDKSQMQRLVEQLDKACYRANDMVAWCNRPEKEIVGKAGLFTEKFIEWVADDQAFYVVLVKEVG